MRVRALWRVSCFNTQPPEGGWTALGAVIYTHRQFQHTAARRRLDITNYADKFKTKVSTHSRPKAAGALRREHGLTQQFQHTATRRRLVRYSWYQERTVMFQHTAARRRLASYFKVYKEIQYVSTHSRPKAAGQTSGQFGKGFEVSTHSRPKAAGRRVDHHRLQRDVSTHSRPKAAGSTLEQLQLVRHGFNTQPPEGGWHSQADSPTQPKGFNTQPPEGGWLILCQAKHGLQFQHTAARRRLAVSRLIYLPLICFNTQPPEGGWLLNVYYNPDVGVSTHSRPKAAGQGLTGPQGQRGVSTHSRPKAAGSLLRHAFAVSACFNTQPPEGGWRPCSIRHR